jgi:hypothetical protein
MGEYGNFLLISQHINGVNQTIASVMKNRNKKEEFPCFTDDDIREFANAKTSDKDVKKYVESLTDDQRADLEEALKIALDAKGKSLLKRNKPSFAWKYLSNNHPDYKEKQEGGNNNVLIINMGESARKARIDPDKLKEKIGKIERTMRDKQSDGTS